MKTQTNKCHSFSVLLFHQFSLYMYIMFAQVSSFKNNCITISLSLGIFQYMATHDKNFPKSSPHKIVFRKKMTALQTSRLENINAKQIQLCTHASSLPFKIGKTYKIVFCEKFLYFLQKILFFIHDTFMQGNSDLPGYCAKKISLLSSAILLLKHFKYIPESIKNFSLDFCSQFCYISIS